MVRGNACTKHNMINGVEDGDDSSLDPCILYENGKECGIKEEGLPALGLHGPTAGWSILTHGELLPGRGLQPGQSAGRV